MSPGSPDVQFQYSRSDESETITVFVGGIGKTVVDSQPLFEQVKEKAFAGDTAVFDLLTAAEAAAKKLERLSDRVTARFGKLYLDGDELTGPLGTKVLEFYQAGVDDWKPLVAFTEKLGNNPNPRSREELFGWLERNQFTITPEGNIVAYKGMRRHTDEDGEVTYAPHYQGHLFIERDGEITEVTADEVPRQKIGDVVTMPRSEVVDNRYQACHVGLHVATLSFARGFSEVPLEVHIDPRDVVSVPDSAEKMRVCRYAIVDEYNEPQPYSEPVLTESQPEEAEPTVDEYHAEMAKQEDYAQVKWGDSPVVLHGFDAPTEEEFATMQKRAKRRRRNFAKYATKHGPWTFVGEDPDSHLSWLKAY